MNMLRQPTWHRLWSEFQANREIRALVARGNSSTEKALRVGLIGLGRVARRHAYGYLKSGRTVITAAFDPSEKQRQKAAKRFAIQKVYADLSEMLQKEKLDLVSICSPPRFHKAAVIAAANAGVQAILCEKPLGLDLAEADEMIRICREKNILLATGHQRRFGEQHVLAKKLLAEKTFGPIRLVFADCPRDILRAGIHAADMLLDYLGPAKAVTACLSDDKGRPAKSPQDACLSSEAGDKRSTILVEFTNGTAAVLRVEDRSGLDARLYFLGEKGEMELWWDGGLRYRLQGDLTWTIPMLKINPYLLEFQRSQEALMDALENKSALPVSGEDGRNSLELILAILTANHEGRRVNLPLNQDQVSQRLASNE